MNRFLQHFFFSLLMICFVQLKAQNHLNVNASYIFPAKFYFQNWVYPLWTNGGWQTGIFCEHEFVTGRFAMVMSTRMRLGLGLSVQHQQLRFSSESESNIPVVLSCEPDEQTLGLRELQIPLRFRFYVQKHTWWAVHVSAAAAFRIPLNSKASITRYSTGLKQSGHPIIAISNGQFAFPLGMGFTRILSNTQLSLDAGYTILSGSYHYTGEKNHGWATDQQIRIKGVFSLSLACCIL